MRSIELALIVTLVVDVILLFTVLLGLFRMRRDGGGMFGLSQLLWKQVGWRGCPRWLSCSPFTDMFFLLLGPDLAHTCHRLSASARGKTT